MVKSLNGFGSSNAGQTSQTAAQHYSTIGPMYRVTGVVDFRGIKRHPYSSQSNTGQSPNSVPMVGQR